MTLPLRDWTIAKAIRSLEPSHKITARDTVSEAMVAESVEVMMLSVCFMIGGDTV